MHIPFDNAPMRKVCNSQHPPAFPRLLRFACRSLFPCGGTGDERTLNNSPWAHEAHSTSHWYANTPSPPYPCIVNAVKLTEVKLMPNKRFHLTRKEMESIMTSLKQEIHEQAKR